MNRRGFFGVLSGATGVAVGLPKAMQDEVAKPVATCDIDITTHSGSPRTFHKIELEQRIFRPDEISSLCRVKLTITA